MEIHKSLLRDIAELKASIKVSRDFPWSETRKINSASILFLRSTFIYLSLQNAVGKMRSLALVLASCFNLLQIVVHCQELSIIRHSDGDIFTIEGKYVYNL